jgi:hypothetical protein
MFEALNEFEHGIDLLEHALGETDRAVATIAAVGRVSIECATGSAARARWSTAPRSPRRARTGPSSSAASPGWPTWQARSRIGDFLAEVKTA